ncbi:MarR family transcriptional regulator [Clostridium sediminicola]|uniref:MarR family transcriptional regulator n=1 Tax=Clostridium sediminicola TaxID=3114879 RepID=UPI0031F1DCA5
MNDISQFIKFIDKLYDFSRVFQEYESIPRNYGTDVKLYMNEVHTLSIVFNNDGITVSEIAEVENKTQSAISQKINKLEKKGLIRKERNPIEYKKINLFATDIGKNICKFHSKLDDTTYRHLISKMKDYDEKDYEKFTKILTIVTTDMQGNIELSKK